MKKPPVVFRVLLSAFCVLGFGAGAFAQIVLIGESSQKFTPPYDLSRAGLGKLLRTLEGSPMPEERLSAAYYLRFLETPAERQEAVMPLFAAFLGDESEEVRRFAGATLSLYVAQRERPNFESVRRAHLDALLAMILPPMEVNLRTQAVEFLGYLGDSRSTPPLVERMYDGFPAVRMAAARAVARLGDVSALQPLRERKDRTPEGSSERSVYEEAYAELVARVEQTTQAIKARRAEKGGKKSPKTVIINPPE